MTTSSGGTSTPSFDDQLLELMGKPKELSPEEAALVMQEKELDLKRKAWHFDKEQEEYETKKRREEEEFQLRKEERKAEVEKNNILFSLLAKLADK